VDFSENSAKAVQCALHLAALDGGHGVPEAHGLQDAKGRPRMHVRRSSVEHPIAPRSGCAWSPTSCALPPGGHACLSAVTPATAACHCGRKCDSKLGHGRSWGESEGTAESERAHTPVLLPHASTYCCEGPPRQCLARSGRFHSPLRARWGRRWCL
jgi:hypothetical protein